MITLTKASEETKEILKWGGLFIAGLFVFFIFLKIVLFLKDTFFPTPPPKPTVAFGKLPAQIFPENATKQKLTYSLDTVSGNLPSLKTQVKIYETVQPQSNLLSLSRTGAMVAQIGFSSNPIQLSTRTYEWKNSSGEDIKIDIVNNNFVFSYPYLSDQNILSSVNVSPSMAIGAVSNMLNLMQMFPDDIDQSKIKTESYSISNNNLAPSTSLSNTQIVKVSLIQKDIDGLPVYYENPNSSSMNFLVGAQNSEGKVVSASFLHQALSNQYSTYPLKTAQQAYDDLQKGNGYIASYYGQSANVVINNIFLAYYIGGGLQNFVMPVVVFQGDNGFYAYVPAVTDEWIGK